MRGARVLRGLIATGDSLTEVDGVNVRGFGLRNVIQLLRAKPRGAGSSGATIQMSFDWAPPGFNPAPPKQVVSMEQAAAGVGAAAPTKRPREEGAAPAAKRAKF